MRRLIPLLAVLIGTVAGTAPAPAGVVNPDISVIGQPFLRWTDDTADPARRRATFAAGETEFVFDAYLNPYARGNFTLALHEEHTHLEEGYFSLLRGLPAGLALKGGKYRAGFGRLNPEHPHVYPFADRFRVLAAYLPGEEALIETGFQLSERFALPGDLALTASMDWLQGDSYRIPREVGEAASDPLAADPAEGDRTSEPRPAALVRLSLFAPAGERSGLEFGLSGTQGTNNVAAGTRTTVWGVDAKAKLWNGQRSYALLQGEWLGLDREQAGWDGTAAAYTRSNVRPTGGYLFADYNWDLRYDVGASYERWQRPIAGQTWDQAFGVFAGLALMEETTVFRLGWERYVPGHTGGVPEDPETVNTLTLRVIYSMGPHKAHQF